MGQHLCFFPVLLSKVHVGQRAAQCVVSCVRWLQGQIERLSTCCLVSSVHNNVPLDIFIACVTWSQILQYDNMTELCPHIFDTFSGSSRQNIYQHHTVWPPWIKDKQTKKTSSASSLCLAYMIKHQNMEPRISTFLHSVQSHMPANFLSQAGCLEGVKKYFANFLWQKAPSTLKICWDRDFEPELVQCDAEVPYGLMSIEGSLLTTKRGVGWGGWWMIGNVKIDLQKSASISSVSLSAHELRSHSWQE